MKCHYFAFARNVVVLAVLTAALLLLAACSSAPSASAIQTAIAQTQAVAGKQSVIVSFVTVTPLHGELTPSPTPVGVGGKRSNPAPPGTKVTTEGLTVVVNGVERPADQVIISANQFNETPAPGFEYMRIAVSITCELGSDEKCDHFPVFEFKLITSSGNLIEVAQVAVDGEMAGEIVQFGGSTESGKLAFLVPSGASGLILTFEPFQHATHAIYLALP